MSSIDDKLLLHYDKDYNRKYDLNQNLNREITTKDQLIYFNEDAFRDKNDYQYIYLNLLYLLLYIILIVILSSMKVISGATLGILIALGIAAYIYYLLHRFYWNKIERGITEARNFARATAKGTDIAYHKGVLPSYHQRFTCPKKCKPRKPVSPLYPIIHPRIPKHIKEMRTDSTENTWLFGEKPYYGSLEKNMKNLTTYECQWMGAGSDNLGKNPSEVTPYAKYIPCEYFPGYKTKCKRIDGKPVGSDC